MFFAFILDAYSRRVIGWQLAGHMRTTLLLDAWCRRPWLNQYSAGGMSPSDHSDRGSQYTSIDYTGRSADHGVLAPVGSVGDAYNNALAESFVDSINTELIANRLWRTPQAARARHRRTPRLVQPRPPAPSARRHAPSRLRGPEASPTRDDHIHRSTE